MAISGTTWSIDKLTLKNKAASDWTKDTTTVLAKGEIGIENDTGKFKLGDGTNKWAGLPYATMTVSEISTALAGKANTFAIPPVVDNLTSTSNTSSLSANQGKVLNEKVAAIKVPTVVNNLTTTATGSTLDASQGKALKDLIDGIKAVTTIAVA